MENKHAVEAFQIVKHHEDLTLSITVRHIDQVIQIVQKLLGTVLPVQHMDGHFFAGRITQQVSDKYALRILHGSEIGVNKQGRGWRHHATSPLLCWF